MAVPKIADLENLISLPKGSKIVEQKSQNLTAAGDNYGSLMLKVDITIEGSSGTQTINAVAKLVPPDEYVQKIFNTQVTYRNEIAFYKTIVPVLQDFQKEFGVEDVIGFTPRYLGSRLNLQDDDNAKVDSNAALILENLKLQNYINVERTIGFDLDTAKLLLLDLAQLHAIPLALKLKKKTVFDTKIAPYLKTFSIDVAGHQTMSNQMRQRLESLEETKPYVERAMVAYDKIIDQKPPREPWGTIAHDDFWVNNTMIKFENDKAMKTKIVDYQICSYGSPARDLVFFLFSSVQNHIITKSYDELIKFYYDAFIKVLKDFNCNLDEFSFGNFEEQLKFEAHNSQFGHIAWMLQAICAPKKGADIKEGENPPMTEEHAKKLIFLVKEFVKRNWI